MSMSSISFLPPHDYELNQRPFASHGPPAFGSVFNYVCLEEGDPMLWYNPHLMDHRCYHFGTKQWSYLD